MAKFFIIVLTFLITTAAINLPSCCQQKQVGGEKYTLLPGKEADGSYGCSSSCVYEKESVPGSRFCFKAGTLEAVCLVRSSEAAPVKEANYKDVLADLNIVLTKSERYWPADYGNYGPFFIRLAWHSAGTYRSSDGRGGANGGRLRFEPERSWPDNANLDKALTLLQPIKKKYGRGLSWADLLILAGNAAIENMGGPVLGFCGGRVDDADGSDSLLLGPSREQEALMPCEVNGQCKSPLGTGTVGLIYVNPEGPMRNPDPHAAAADIRDVFGRMAMNNSETVALIGGGHTLGKSHGGCPIKVIDKPACGTKKGIDTVTSGIELTWTTEPTYWDNEYFRNLVNLEYTLIKGQGNTNQWEASASSRKKTGKKPSAKSADGTFNQTIGMFTTDVALFKDEAYKSIVLKFAEDKETFDNAFAYAWYKLTTRDMGPVSRCRNKDTPPPQTFQYPLPDSPAELPDFEAVKQKIVQLLDENVNAIGMFIRLAWQCSSTFRSTDYLGGCNGARIRFSPQKDWLVNINLKNALNFLQTIKNQFEANLSWADLIILAGNTALEKVGGKPLKFCGGRTDATDGLGSEFLFPKITGNFSETLNQLNDFISIMGLTKVEFAALYAVGYSVGCSKDCDGLYCRRNSFQGSTPVSTSLTNIFFEDLLSNTWEEYTIPSTGKQVYRAAGKDDLMLGTDLHFRSDPVLLAISQDFQAEDDLFLSVAATAWTKLTNADRFHGPSGNVCYK